MPKYLAGSEYKNGWQEPLHAYDMLGISIIFFISTLIHIYTTGIFDFFSLQENPQMPPWVFRDAKTQNLHLKDIGSL